MKPVAFSLLLAALGRLAAAADPGNSTTTTTMHGWLPASSMLHRALYVLLGLSGLGILYFSLRSIRLKKTQRKKYGLLSSYDDHVEMAAMDTDDDTTLFEAKSVRRSVDYSGSHSC
uniref:Putative membrane protein C19orf24-like protein n=1 Tax=Callorhinchus milii TaxID=7868 RepID=V9L6J7_CALMI|eukprot:gi/632961747/ref/XP_007896932.1/ PREDICTED: uncharacterized membrane protein C19orf24 homolog [Callorhinchus milii]